MPTAVQKNSPIKDLIWIACQFLSILRPKSYALRQAAKVLVRGTIGGRNSKQIEGVRPPRSAILPLAIPSENIGLTHVIHLKIAAICHVYHQDIFSEIISSLKNIPEPCDILVSTDTEEKKLFFENSLGDWKNGSVTVRVIPNRGRDIPSKLIAFNDLLDHYDLVLFIHGKRAETIQNGDAWRKYLIHNLCGSREIANTIIRLFVNNDKLGIVAPANWEPVRQWMDWGSNYDICHSVGAKMGLKLTAGHIVEFPAGSMFWCRPPALTALRSLNFTMVDFPAEPIGTNGTLAHAIERLFFYACEISGYKWVSVIDLETCRNDDNVTHIDREDSITEARDIQCFSLLPSVRNK